MKKFEKTQKYLKKKKVQQKSKNTVSPPYPVLKNKKFQICANFKQIAAIRVTTCTKTYRERHVQ